MRRRPAPHRATRPVVWGPRARPGTLVSPAMDATQWLAAYAQRIGIAPPTEAEVEQLLALAGVAAHASERIAAPVACWLTARAQLEPAAALAIAQEVADA